MSNYDEEYIENLHRELAQKEADKDALIAEFTEAIQTNKEFSADDLKKRFKGLMAGAYEVLVDLLNNAESEAVRLSAVKYIFNIGIGAVKITDGNDPEGELKELLKALSGDKEVKDEVTNKKGTTK